MNDFEKNMKTAPSVRKTTVTIFLFFSFAFLLNAGGHVYSIDEIIIMETAKSLAAGKGFGLVPRKGLVLHSTMPGRDGKQYSKYSPLNSIVMAPVAAVGLKLTRLLPAGADDSFAVYFVCSFVNSFVSAATVAVLFMLCCTLGFSCAVSLAVCLMFGFGTIALPYAKMSFSETGAGLMIITCFAGLAAHRRGGRMPHLIAACVAAALLPLARLSSVIALAPLFAYAVWPGTKQSRVKSAAWLSAGIAAGFAAYAFYNHLRFGSFLETGYGKEASEFGTPLLLGLYGLLASSDKSFFVYSPVLVLSIFGAVLAVRRGASAEAVCAVGILVLHVIMSAMFHSWGGGHVWGPRYLVPAVPAFAVLTAWFVSGSRGRPVRMAVAVALIAAGVFVQAAATSEKFIPHYENATVMDIMQTEYSEGTLLRPGMPRFLPLKVQVRHAVKNYAYTMSHAREYLRPADNSLKGMIESDLVDNAPDFWFLPVFISSGTKMRVMVVLAVVVLLAGAAMTGLRLLPLLQNHNRG